MSLIRPRSRGGGNRARARSQGLASLVLLGPVLAGIVLAGTVLGSMVLAGCEPIDDLAGNETSPAGTAITFSISVTNDEKPAIQALLARFEARSRTAVNLELLSRFRDPPASRVNLVTSITADALVRRLQADKARGQPSVSLFAQDNLALKPLVDDGLVQDLSSVGIPGAVDRSLIPPTFDGKQFFLPFRPNVRLAYVDVARLSRAGLRAPTTVQDLRTVAERLKATEGRPAVTLSLAEGDPAAVTVSEWILSYGGNPLVLDDKGSVQAFQFLQGLWRDGLLARESLFAKFDTEVANLEKGTAAVTQNWSFTSAQLARAGMLSRFMVYPGWRGPKGAAHVVGGDVLGIPVGVTGRQRQEALALARFLMSKEAQEYLVAHNDWPSIRSDAYATVAPGQRPTFDAITRALRDGWFRPSVSYWPEVSQAMNEAVDRILLQDQPARPVLDQLHRQIARAARAQGAPYPPKSDRG